MGYGTHSLGLVPSPQCGGKSKRGQEEVCRGSGVLGPLFRTPQEFPVIPRKFIDWGRDKLVWTASHDL